MMLLLRSLLLLLPRRSSSLHSRHFLCLLIGISLIQSGLVPGVLGSEGHHESQSSAVPLAASGISMAPFCEFEWLEVDLKDLTGPQLGRIVDPEFPGVKWTLPTTDDSFTLQNVDHLFPGYYEILIEQPLYSWEITMMDLVFPLSFFAFITFIPQFSSHAYDVQIVDTDPMRTLTIEPTFTESSPCEILDAPVCGTVWKTIVVSFLYTFEGTQMWIQGQPVKLGSFESEFPLFRFLLSTTSPLSDDERLRASIRYFPGGSCVQDNLCIPGTCGVPGSVCRRPGHSCECEDAWKEYPNCGDSDPSGYQDFLNSGTMVEIMLCAPGDYWCEEDCEIQEIPLQECSAFSSAFGYRAIRIEVLESGDEPDYLIAQIWENPDATADCSAPTPDYELPLHSVTGSMFVCAMHQIGDPLLLPPSDYLVVQHGHVRFKCSPECPSGAMCVRGKCVCRPGLSGDPLENCSDPVCLQDCSTLSNTECPAPMTHCECDDFVQHEVWKWLFRESLDQELLVPLQGCPLHTLPQFDPGDISGLGVYEAEERVLFSGGLDSETSMDMFMIQGSDVYGAFFCLGKLEGDDPCYIRLDLSPLSGYPGVVSTLAFNVPPGLYTMGVENVLGYGASPDLYAARGAIDITGLVGCARVQDGDLMGCPTSGKENGEPTEITIHGFPLFDPIVLTFGQVAANTIQSTRHNATVLLPPGVGSGLQVTLSMRGNYYVFGRVFYGSPVIERLVGCGMDVNVTDGEGGTLRNCPRVSTQRHSVLIPDENGDPVPTELVGELISIHGRNFHDSGAQVWIDDERCFSWHDEENPHERVLALLPNSTGSRRVIRVQQAVTNSLSSENALLNYEPCPPGTFMDEDLRRCEACPPGQISSSTDSPSCQPCGQGTYSHANRTVCVSCEPGTANPSKGADECEPCPENSFQNRAGGFTCEQCGELAILAQIPGSTEFECREKCDTGEYPVLDPGGVFTGECRTCPVGAVCQMEGIFAEQNFYLVRDRASGEVLSYPCQLGHCRDARSNTRCMDQFDECGSAVTGSSNGNEETRWSLTARLSRRDDRDMSMSSVPDYRPHEYGQVYVCCGPNRECPESNVLCGQCIPGTYEWNGECVECDSKGRTAGLLVLMILMSIAFVVVFYRASQSTTGYTKIFLYFLQMNLLYLHDSSGGSSWLSWMNIFNFNVLDAAGSSCVMPLEPLAKMMMGLVMPVFYLFLLGCMAAVHYLYHSTARPVEDRPNWLPQEFSKDRYIRAMIAFMIFAYNQVALTALRFFDCVDVRQSDGSEIPVIRAYPAVECGGSSYNSVMPLMIIVLVVIVTGGPLVMLAWTLNAWRRGLLVRFTKRIQERLRELQAERDQHYSGPFSNPEFVDVTKPGESGDERKMPTSSAPVGVSKLEALSKKATSAKEELDASNMTVEEMTRIVSFQSRWGIIYETYRPKSFYYEFVVIARRVFAIAMAVAITDRDQMLSVLTVLNTVFLSIHLTVKPFNQAAENFFETVSLVILTIVTALLSSMKIPLDGGESALFACLVLIPASALVIHVLFITYTKLRSLWLERFGSRLDDEKVEDDFGADSDSDSEFIPPVEYENEGGVGGGSGFLESGQMPAHAAEIPTQHDDRDAIGTGGVQNAPGVEIEMQMPKT